jgi:hypothetical protein
MLQPDASATDPFETLEAFKIAIMQLNLRRRSKLVIFFDLKGVEQ